MTDADDPIVASYDVVAERHSASADGDSPQLFLLQYSSHRPANRPYSSARHQKPTSFRYKTNTGLVEVDVPIVTSEYYNHEAGGKYGAAMAESRTVRVGGSHGLAGGFNPGPAQVSSLNDIPAHQDPSRSRPELATQTLGGKIARPTEGEPIYFLGSFRDNALHLSHLDAVVQMRPQLHHIDAEDEINQRRLQMSGGPAGSKKPGFEMAPKMESKAIEMKLKDSKEDPRDRSLNANNKLLRDIQMDAWQRHEWMDEDHVTSKARAEELLYRSPHPDTTTLKSSLSNGDWLDRMSAPREDGKKGLLAKLRGRERERARRKKAEEEKKKSKEAAVTTDPSKGPLLEQSSDSDLSSPEASDVEQDASKDVEMQDALDAPIEIKEEPEPQAAPVPAPAKKRGRPKKVQTGDAG